MEKAEYESLVEAYREGRLGTLDPRRFSPSGAQALQLLSAYSRRNWESFRSDNVSGIPSGDLHFLIANSWFLRARYSEASRQFDEALRAFSADCLLFTPELVAFNQFVIRSFGKEFTYRRELPMLRQARRGALKRQDFFIVALVLNSYGNHYFQRGVFRRAFSLYRAALRMHSRQAPLRLTNYLDTLGNCIRAGLQIGEFAEAERLVRELNARVLEAGDTSFKERFDRVFAEFLAAHERYHEALTHLDFSMNPASPFESCRMMLLKAQILVELGKPGAPELLTEVDRFIRDHDLGDDSLIDFHSTRASALMAAGDFQDAYRSLMKAETLAYTHRNSHLRASVMFHKARLNALQGKPEVTCGILMEVVKLAHSQRFVLLLLRTLHQLADVAIRAQLTAADRVYLEKVFSTPLPWNVLSRTQAAIEALRDGWSPARATPAPPTSGHADVLLEIREKGPEEGIFLRRDGRREELAQIHRMTGKLLLELLREPNRDVSLDQLHLKLWGGPIRNESHVQKLKTLASRLRSELREKNAPVEIVSREYASYRAVTKEAVTF